MEIDLGKTTCIEFTVDDRRIQIEVYKTYDQLTKMDHDLGKRMEQFRELLKSEHGVDLSYEHAVELNNCVIGMYVKVSAERKKKLDALLGSVYFFGGSTDFAQWSNEWLTAWEDALASLHAEERLREGSLDGMTDLQVYDLAMLAFDEHEVAERFRMDYLDRVFQAELDSK